MKINEAEQKLNPRNYLTGEQIRTPRGNFHVTALSISQMRAAGYGIHHISDDGKYQIMGNGECAYAVLDN